MTKAPDLVIADVIMPSLSGVELAVVIRETCPD
jgi:YesN/AraC family two-component response regulator